MAGRAEERAEGFAGERLFVLAAAGIADGLAGDAAVDATGDAAVDAAGAVSGGVDREVATGVRVLRKLFPAACGVWTFAFLGNLAVDFFATEADLLADAVTSSTEVSSVF